MNDKKLKERVVAEISVPYLVQVAAECGISLTREQAVDFLNRDGRAYDIWKHMMGAGEECIRQGLRREHRRAGLGQSRNHPAVAV